MNDLIATKFELRFQPLLHSGRGFSFPCDPKGRVDLDELTERGRYDYLYARKLVGRELALPTIVTSH